MGSIWTIRRSTGDRKLTGLCGGIAAHWGIDPLLVRIGGVLLALSGGVGLVLYLAGWLLIPEQDSERSKLEELVGPRIRKVPREAWIAIVVVASVISISVFGSLLPFGLGPALILAGIWYFGYHRGRRNDGRTSSTEEPTTPPVGQTPPSPYVQSPPSQSPYAQHPYAQNPHTQNWYGQDQARQNPTDRSGQTPTADSPFAQAAEAWRRRVAEASGQPSAEHTRPAADPGPARHQEPTGPAGPAAPTDYQQPPWARVDDRGRTQPDPAVADAQARAAYFSNPDPIGLYHPEPALPVPVAPARPADRPSARRLRLIGLIAVGLVLAGLGTADALGAPITATIYVAAALLVVGITLVAATWLGRARGILPIGIVLAFVLAAVSVAGAAQQVQDMARDVRVYATPADLPTTPIVKEFGWLELDLSQVELTKNTTVAANVDVGTVRVHVPEGVNLNIRYRVDNGSVLVLDRREQSGSDLADEVPVAVDPKAPTLTLDLQLDQGYLEVTR
ncbi:PspC domain-containing protein [Microlunatus parietis]|uniref:Phage shock protein PspC (Stress-responsive transcriptional regulator) n=1 Tax=Microlunatus parietis TaxID=682979 RepID=A0A7Y9I6D9_9ACTN|nr:PspC domain-containing protein [Microlunatus parietis]NYE70977.1 phage shock protein PspC (stress-responsive transcriptional regulator) [Microlunatus parietis]